MRNILIDFRLAFCDSNSMAPSYHQPPYKLIILLLMTASSFVLSSCQDKRIPIHLGQTLEECRTVYGQGEIKSDSAPGTKTVFYGNTPERTTAQFENGTVVSIQYDVKVDTAEDKRLKRYLTINAQGHQWALKEISSAPSIYATWVRDDGVSASYYDTPFPTFSIIPALEKKK